MYADLWRCIPMCGDIYLHVPMYIDIFDEQTPPILPPKMNMMQEVGDSSVTSV